MNTLQAYLLGLATIPGLALIGGFAFRMLALTAQFFARRGWFVEFGKAPEPGLTVPGLLTTRRRFGFITTGVWRTREKTGRPCSRWVQVGRICVGRKVETVPPLSEDEYQQMRAASQAADAKRKAVA